MSLKKLLCLGALLSGFTLAGCAVPRTSSVPTALCHPRARVCVKSCASPTDCPETANALWGQGRSRRHTDCPAPDTGFTPTAHSSLPLCSGSPP